MEHDITEVNQLKQYYYGFYSTNIYLPFSTFSKKWRMFWQKYKEKKERFMQRTSLPTVSWKNVLKQSLIRLVEEEKEDGNIRISELGILAQLSKECEEGSLIFEIGTFDGRTTVNLAINAPLSCQVLTLDLPPEQATKHELASGESHYVDKPKPGVKYRKYAKIYQNEIARVSQLLGDSATYDYQGYINKCALVFVDGSHAYDYAKSDSYVAMQLVKMNG